MNTVQEGETYRLFFVFSGKQARGAERDVTPHVVLQFPVIEQAVAAELPDLPALLARACRGECWSFRSRKHEGIKTLWHRGG